MTAALALAAALALTACGRGEDEPPAPTPRETAAATQDRGPTATATHSPSQAAPQTPTETDEAPGQDAEESGGSGTDDTDDEGTGEGTAGTGEGTAGGTVEAPATGEATEPDDDTDDDGQDDDSDGVVGGGPAADLTPSALAALETSLGQAEGAAYQVDDREDGFWEVGLSTADGPVVVTVAPDGTTVDGVVAGSDDTLGDAGRQALAGAQVPLAEAIVAAVRASAGQLDAAELAQLDGAWWWRVTVDSPSQQDIELRVDPATGEVVATAG